jgi:DNA-directed RNA polymerase subunit RPC12/RpoP
MNRSFYLPSNFQPPLECPRCGHYCLVQLTSTSYGCLNCHYHVDLSLEKRLPELNFGSMMLMGLGIAIVWYVAS